MPIFTSGIVLLLNIWGGKRSGININPVKEMKDVHRCMSALSQSEKRYLVLSSVETRALTMSDLGGTPLEGFGTSCTNL